MLIFKAFYVMPLNLPIQAGGLNGFGGRHLPFNLRAHRQSDTHYAATESSCAETSRS